MTTVLKLPEAARLYYGADEAARLYYGTELIWPWTPQVLFTAGVIGAWYDVNDLSTLYQERTGGGTTPSVVGGVVGTLRDKSGQGNHAFAASDAARPILRQSGSIYYLEYDGVDDQLTTATFITSGKPSYPGFVGVEFSKRSNGADVAVFSFIGASVANSFGLNNGGVTGRFNASHRNPVDPTLTAIGAANSMDPGVQRTIMGYFAQNYIRLYVDNGTPVENNSTFNPANFATEDYKIEVGRTATMMEKFFGAVYLSNKSLTSDELEKLKVWLGRTGGRSLI